MNLDDEPFASEAAAAPPRHTPQDMQAMAARALAVCPHGMLVADARAPGFPVTYANPTLCRSYAAEAAELTGPGWLFLQDDARASAHAALRAALDQGSEVTLLLPLCGRDGEPGWSELRVTPMPDQQGAIAQLLCTFTDVTELTGYKDKLAFHASHDPLTGLPNRAMFDALFEQRLRQAEGDGAVLCLCISNFNLVNESLGHVAGDQFLQAVAQRLLEFVGGGAALSRHGRNEFALIVDAPAGAHAVRALCERIGALLAPPFVVAERTLHADCSIGAALFPQDAGDGVSLLRFANMALTHARAEGNNGYQFFNAEMNVRTTERIEMGAALRTALARGELQLRYQPMADLQDGALCGLEALVRWQHADFGLISAQRFIPIAEEAGVIGEIGAWVLRRACQDMADWSAAGLAPPRVAVNISTIPFRDHSLPARIAATLAEFGIAPARLALEIKEAALMEDAHASAHTLGALKALGVGLTLDDFGTGYSSLSHLKRFPLDLVKIDCALTGSIAHGAEDAALVKTIIEMAHHLGIKVVAEGVETEAQCDFLRRNMCDQIQGYFFGAPVDAAEIAALLGRRHALPAHLLRIQRQKRTLLLVDDEQNIVSALKRLLRRDAYEILTANSGQEGLDVLASNSVDVIVSDQRMPGMLGADFLRAAKNLYPHTIRIMLSGYTELQSVTDAVNEGAIYKFLTKPWDDELLRGHIADAFRLKEIADENERLNLELRTANHELAAANRKMEELLRQKQQQIAHGEISLNVARELLQLLPLPIIGLDDAGMVAFVNAAAAALFRKDSALLGNDAALVLPELFPHGVAHSGAHGALIGGQQHQVVVHPMGAHSQSRGSLITIERRWEPR